MPITIPTSDLTNLIGDALVFAPVDKDAWLRGILVEWDGEVLRASAFDTLSGAVVTWNPDDVPEAESGDKYASTEWAWGAEDGDSQWSVFLYYDDAKEIVKTFRLAAKFARTPVVLDAQTFLSDDRPTRLHVSRVKQAWCVRHSMTVESAERKTVEQFPDIRSIITDAMVTSASDPDSPVFSGSSVPMLFNLARLAQFGMTHSYGVSRVTYLGEGLPTTIHGPRVEGFIYPVSKAATTRADARRAAARTV